MAAIMAAAMLKHSKRYEIKSASVGSAG